VNLQNLVSLRVLQYLSYSARPADFNAHGHILLAQSEMHTLVAGGLIAARRGHRRILRPCLSHQADFRTDSIAIALVPHQIESTPVILRGRLVVKDMHRAAVRGD